MSNLIVFRKSAPVSIHQFHSYLLANESKSRLIVDTLETQEWHMAVSHLHGAPLNGPRKYETDRWAAVFAGDLVDQDAVPFKQIVSGLETGCFSDLVKLEGKFVIAAYDKTDQRLFAVSDRTSQKPYFYNLNGGKLQLSSNLASFVRLLDAPEFNREWLWESLYFNFPAGDSTFLKRVKRMPPASVLMVDRDKKITVNRYAEDFSSSLPLVGGTEGLRLAFKVFSERVPVYFSGADEVACALTSGWDGRTMLALAPDVKNVCTYTYGVPGCSDIVKAANVAKKLGIRHLSIPFDRGFERNLPRHSLEAVFLSGGQLGVLRSTLHHAYNVLTSNGERFPLTISGIALDQLFRGHANTPSIVSPDLARHFQGEGVGHDATYWRTKLGTDYQSFASHIASQLHSLEAKFGPLNLSAHHLAYVIYRIVPQYFAGELAIADHFTTVRVPSIDAAVIRLAASIEQSTLSLSRFLPNSRQDCREEMILQSYILRETAPSIYRLSVNGKYPPAVMAGEIPFQIGRIYLSAWEKIRKSVSFRGSKPLEDWDAWIFDQNQPFLEDLLFSSKTRVTEYVLPAFINEAIAKRDLHMVGKLLTTEIILRLIDARWQKFW